VKYWRRWLAQCKIANTSNTKPINKDGAAAIPLHTAMRLTVAVAMYTTAIDENITTPACVNTAAGVGVAYSAN